MGGAKNLQGLLYFGERGRGGQKICRTWCSEVNMVMAIV